MPAEQLPLQVPLPAQAARAPCGAPELSAVQVPTAPATSHASHAPVQAALQHTPSTQREFWHWLFAVQAVPLGRNAVQLPAAQYGAALLQSLLPPQPVRQAVPPALQIRLPEQALLLALGQWPAPSQLAAAVSIEPVQLCVRHETAGKVQVWRDALEQAPAQGAVPAHAARAPRG